MTIQLFDTFSRRKRVFVPLRPPAVGLYTCGPTVYHDQHLGNFRTFLFEDGLRRVLELAGHAVNHVMNVTDVGHLTSDADEGEDKLEKGSRRTGLSAIEVAERYTRAFVEDVARLNVLPPTTLCRATAHLPEQIAYVAELEAKGFTYRTGDGVYFDTAKQPDYGQLARLDREGLRSGERVSMGEKRRATDFALWKTSPEVGVRQMEWASPWGIGFPGWHLECSAMARRYLGDLFDIHCGGEDHVPVHHTNEIAQSEAATGTRMARYWLHGRFLTFGGGKISKSDAALPGDELLGMSALIEAGFDPLAFRHLCLGGHYRARLSFTWDALGAAAAGLSRLRRAIRDVPESASGEPSAGLASRFTARLHDDLDFPGALALAHEVVRANVPAGDRRATLLFCDRALGLSLGAPRETTAPADVESLAAEREMARRQGDFAAADRLRRAIAERGYRVEDTPAGPRLEPG